MQNFNLQQNIHITLNIQRIIGRKCNELLNEISLQTQLELTEQELIYLMVQQYRYKFTDIDIIKFLLYFIPSFNFLLKNEQNNFINITLTKQNALGRILASGQFITANDVISSQKFINTLQLLCFQHNFQQNQTFINFITRLFKYFLQRQGISIALSHKYVQRVTKKKKRLTQFLTIYQIISKKKQQHAFLQQMREQNEHLDLKQTYLHINNYKQLPDNDQKNLKQFTLFKLCKLYKTHLQDLTDDVRFSFIEFINYIENLSDNKVTQLFSSLNQKQAFQFVDTLCLDNKPIKTREQLAVKLIYNLYVEMCQLWLSFSDNFRFEHIDDEQWHHIFNCQEKGLLQLYPRKGQEIITFVIIRDIKSKKLLRCTDLADPNIKKISKNNIYDIIAFQQCQKSTINGFRVRYLTWHHISVQSECQLTIQHPKDIISLNLSSVQLLNLHECQNIVNFYSECGVFKFIKSEVVFPSLKRFASFGDKFQPCISTFLQEILKQSKVSYICLQTRQMKPEKTIIEIQVPYLRFLGFHNEIPFQFKLSQQDNLLHVSTQFTKKIESALPNLFSD